MISTSVTVGTTPTVLVASAVGFRTVYLHVVGNEIVYLGGETVTTSTGTNLEKHTNPIAINLEYGQSLYGIVAAGTADVRVLRGR